jgi:hypothetical protein
MTKKHALRCFICSLNFKSHNFQTESPFKRVAPTYRGGTTLSFFSPCYALCLGHFEFKTLLMLSSAFSKRPKLFCTRPSNWLYVRNQHKQVFFGTKNFSHSANLQATIRAAGFLRVLPRSSFKKLLLGTRLWQHAKMSTSLKSSDGLKDAEWEKRQLSCWSPIPYVPVVDIVTPKKETQLFKVKLPDTSHLSMAINSRGNNTEYLAHIVAVLRIIDQKGLPKKCRMLAKAVEESPGSCGFLRNCLDKR